MKVEVKVMSDLVVLVDSKYDSLFKEIITAGWCIKSDGHVESPQGYFALVEIPAHRGELVEMFDAVEPQSLGDLDEWPESGWYVTVENSDGLIHVYKCAAKYLAEDAFAEREGAFARWDAE